MKKLISLLLLLSMLIPAASAETLPDTYNWYEIFVYSYQDSDGDGIGDWAACVSAWITSPIWATPAYGSCPSCLPLPIISTT